MITVAAREDRARIPIVGRAAGANPRARRLCAEWAVWDQNQELKDYAQSTDVAAMQSKFYPASRSKRVLISFPRIVDVYDYVEVPLRCSNRCFNTMDFRLISSVV